MSCNKPSSKCAECGATVTPRRARTVPGAIESGSNIRAITYIFCAACHPQVFADADWRKYPGLFTEIREWRPELGEWSLACEVAPYLDLCGKGFSSLYHAHGGSVRGIEFERAWCGNSKRWLYRGIEP